MTQFYLQKTEPVFRVTALANLSYYRFPENFSFAGESHDFWELTYVDKGQITVQQDGNAFLLKAGEMLLCKPNVFHTCHVCRDIPAWVVDIEFSVDTSLPENFDNEIMILNAEERQCMAAIIREASQTYAHFNNLPAQVQMEQAENVPYGSQQIICNRLEELLIYACRGNRSIHIDRRLISPELSANLPGQIQTYLQEHFSEKITLERIAQEHGISITKLKRIFREEIGTSVIPYLTRLRIKEAKHLIRQDKLNFTQIAEAVGFESIHYFSAVFKKQTGITPTQYANSIKQKS